MAGRIEGITVEIGGDAAGLQKEINKINSSLQATTRELKGVDSLLRLDPGNVDLLRQKEELLNKSLEEQEAKLKQLKTSKKNLDQSMANGTEVNQKEYRNLVREIAATENKVKSLKTQIKSFGSIGKQQAKAVGTSFEEAGDKIKNAGSKLKTATAGIVQVQLALLREQKNLTGTYQDWKSMLKQLGLVLISLKTSLRGLLL